MANDGEPECSNNVQLFRIAVSHSLRNIAECVSEDEFTRILAILRPKTAKKLHKAMVQELYNGLNGDLEAMLDESALQDALTKVAKLSDDCATPANKDAWRPPGNVALHMRSFDAQTMKRECEELEKRVSEMEEENEGLMKSIAESRSKIRGMDKYVTKMLDHGPIVLQQLENTHQQLATCAKIIDNE